MRLTLAAVIALGLASASARADGPDVGVKSVDFRLPVRTDRALELKVVVGYRGLEPGQKVTVQLWTRDRTQKLAEQSEAVPQGAAAAGELTAVLNWTPRSVGRAELLIHVVAPPGCEEADAANNDSLAAVEVEPGQLSVLLIDQRPRWEFRHLGSVLTADKSVRLSSFLLDAEPGTGGGGDLPIMRLPAKPEEWNAFDVLILGDVNPKELTPGQLKLIDAYVRGGGTLIVIAGDQSMPRAYVGTPIERLLPVAIEANPPAAEKSKPFALRLTDAGQASPLLELPRVEKGKPGGQVEKLPEMFWFAPVKGVVPGAAVLATTADESAAPLLVVGRCGRGCVFFSAVDSTWRWRAHVGSEVHGRYWRHLVRALWLGEGIPTTQPDDEATTQPDEPAAAPPAK
ncbi:MAG: hypothetical protein BIFFINMI_02582 [Phycisphaerae bacterium]|nr:hypothetical protein [Phycisphaerae bacterium]